MKKKKMYLILGLILTIGSVFCYGEKNTEEKTKSGKIEDLKKLSLEEFTDKVRGAWVGKMLGVEYGMPFEFAGACKTIDAKIEWKPEKIKNSLGNDDLYVQMSFLMTMDKYGMDAPAEKFADSFANAGFGLCHANREARKNIWDGIKPPLSGNPEYTLHADDIDFQIESDFIGFLNPGMPVSSNEMCDKIGHIMCYGDGVYGGMFVSAMDAAAFVEKDIKKIVECGLASIPAGSDYAKCINDVISGYRKNPVDWKKTWAEVNDTWGRADICVPFHDFNIDAKINGAFIVIGLLYGGGDFDKTIEIATRCGQDSDCNSSNAAGILGIINGYSKIPEKYKQCVPEIKDKNFLFTDYTLEKAVEKTVYYAKQNIEKNGGKTDEKSVMIKVQKPVPPENLEISFPGLKGKEAVLISDQSRWTWEGKWEDSKLSGDGSPAKIGREKDSALTFKFNGTCVLLTGVFSENGGKADVYIDGKPVRTIDTWYKGNSGCIDFANAGYLFSKINLPKGDHELKLIVKGEKRPESKGTEVCVSRAVVYDTK